MHVWPRVFAFVLLRLISHLPTCIFSIMTTLWLWIVRFLGIHAQWRLLDLHLLRLLVLLANWSSNMGFIALILIHLVFHFSRRIILVCGVSVVDNNGLEVYNASIIWIMSLTTTCNSSFRRYPLFTFQLSLFDFRAVYFLFDDLDGLFATGGDFYVFFARWAAIWIACVISLVNFCMFGSFIINLFQQSLIEFKFLDLPDCL